MEAAPQGYPQTAPPQQGYTETSHYQGYPQTAPPQQGYTEVPRYQGYMQQVCVSLRHQDWKN